ncbi:hypothetical protein [Epilithonimonas vandammei]|nr:hypothetical protein [Epilithonimonas vandammei]
MIKDLKMDPNLQIQNKKLELIQWLSTIEDLNFLEKISEFISRENKKDWADLITDTERQSIEKGIAQADAGKLNPHSKAREIYRKRI